MRLSLILGLLLFSCDCTHQSTQSPPSENFAEFDLAYDLPLAEPPKNSSEYSQRLDLLLKAKPRRIEVMPELPLIIKAEEAEIGRDQEAALRYWLEAAKLAKSKFSKACLERWLRLYQEILGAGFEVETIARLLLNESNQGQSIDFLKSQGLTSTASLVPLLDKMMASSKALGPTLTPELKEWAQNLKSMRGVPEQDPLLHKSAQALCLGDASTLQATKAWQKTLGLYAGLFLEGKIAECKAQVERAIQLYEKISNSKLSQSKELSFQIMAGYQLIGLYKATGSRENVARIYESLVRDMAKSPVNFSLNKGQRPLDFRLEWINQTIWAARYKAIIGDYHAARAYLNQGETLIAKTTRDFKINPLDMKKVIQYEAELYHTRAFRVLVEQKLYQEALTETKKALNIKGLDQDWTERFSWYLGLYEYLAGSTKEAHEHWKNLNEQILSSEQKPALLFWLARISASTDPSSSEDYLRELLQSYPLSFYSLIAPDIAGLKVPSIEQRFGPIEKLKQTLASRRFKPEILFSNPELKKQTLRALLATGVGLDSWAKLAIQELHSTLRLKLSPKMAPEAYLLVAKLYSRVQDHFGVISLLTQLADQHERFWELYPEQILLNFPQPYTSLIRSEAKLNNLDPYWIWAVARQESSFRPEISSPAGAIGLMQLMPASAKKLARKLSIDLNDVALALIRPEHNVKLGSAYLRELGERYNAKPAQVFGAYNAGEYMIDTWEKRRAHEDPLIWIELVPFAETKGYMRNVWRNVAVYRFLNP